MIRTDVDAGAPTNPDDTRSVSCIRPRGTCGRWSEAAPWINGKTPGKGRQPLAGRVGAMRRGSVDSGRQSAGRKAGGKRNATDVCGPRAQAPLIGFGWFCLSQSGAKRIRCHWGWRLSLQAIKDLTPGPRASSARDLTSPESRIAWYSRVSFTRLHLGPLGLF